MLLAARAAQLACTLSVAQEVQKSPSAANKYINDPRMMQARAMPVLAAAAAR